MTRDGTPDLDEPTPQTTWEGTASLESLDEEAGLARQDLATAARTGVWMRVFEILAVYPTFVNACRPGGTSLYAPLHQAAYAGAPADVIERLVDLGAWRTLRNAHGGRPLDIARVRGHIHLYHSLTPQYTVRVPAETLSLIQRHFHHVIVGREGGLVERHRLRLPELEPLLELDGRKTWFAVPGMYGGFSYWLTGAGTDATLISESWSRIAGGSGQRHEITAAGSRMVEEGFV
jgi:hypothetical protein